MLFDYRSGADLRALETFEELGSSNEQVRALGWAIRALAEHRLGRVDQARDSLAEANRLIPAETRFAANSRPAEVLPVSRDAISHNWLIPEILKREAAAALAATEPAETAP